MSEVLETPLNPEVEVTAVETVDETPEVDESAAPEVDKVRQIQQQEAANRRKFEERQEAKLASALDEIKAMIAKGGTATTSQADKLAALKADLAAEAETLSPRMRNVINGLIEEAESRQSTQAEIATIKREQQAQRDYEAFMADKPRGFSEAYSKHQRELVAELREQGEDVADNERALRIAMAQWSKAYMAQVSKAAKTPAASVPGRGTVIPSGTGTRAVPNTKTPMQILNEGKHGNLLGLKLGQVH